MRSRYGLFLGLLVFAAVSVPARADLYLESFTPTNSTPDSGYVLFGGATQYVSQNVDGMGHTGGLVNTSNANDNAWIIQNTTATGFPGIAQAQDGPGGWFLFENTGNPGSGFTGVVWESNAPVSVMPNTDYQFSFYLTNENSTNNAEIAPVINGVQIGSPVSANGYYLDGNPADQWQQFTFTWNSGSATTATLGLFNYQDTGFGNDVGIDTITLNPVAAVPAPSTAIVAVFGAVAFIAYGGSRHRREQRRQAVA